MSKMTRKFGVHNRAVLAVCLSYVGASHGAPVAPGAGTILQQANPVGAPSALPRNENLKLPETIGHGMDASTPIEVKRIEVTGNYLVDTVSLHALVSDGEGKTLTLKDLDGLADRITHYYREKGYLLSRAVIPAQKIEGGVVTVEVIEAHYGKVNLDNRSGVSNRLLEATLSGLVPEQVVEQGELNRSLLLLSDIPGVLSEASVGPGAGVGESDLDVTAKPVPWINGNLALDNYGNKYTGLERLGGTANLLNPLGIGDALSVTGLTSGSGMSYGRGGYEWLLDGEGTRAGGSYSALHYQLGDSLSKLNGYGSAQVGSLWIKHPFVRSQSFDLTGQAEFDRLTLSDVTGTANTNQARHLDDWVGSLVGDSQGVHGISNWSLGLTAGRVGFDNTAAMMTDGGTVRTQGAFTKWNLALTRVQHVSGVDDLYGALTGQWAGRNLDFSQQMMVGGPYSVRAYQMGVMTADAGYLGTVEWRHNWSEAWQSVVFYDSERVVINQNTWAGATGPNGAVLSGGGVGLNWHDTKGWSASGYLAERTGSVPSQISGAPNGLFWVQLAKAF